MSYDAFPATRVLAIVLFGLLMLFTLYIWFGSPKQWRRNRQIKAVLRPPTRD
jgi:type II secretory pathway pseudopilin PulG